MARFIKGDIVILPFPFSDLSGTKRRPAFVLAEVGGSDILLCQITSRATNDKFSVPITNSDFTSGALPVDSNIRPNKIFTADKNIIIRKAGSLKRTTVEKVVAVIVKLISS